MRTLLALIATLLAASCFGSVIYSGGTSGGFTSKAAYDTLYGSVPGGFHDLASPTLVSSAASPMGDDEVTAPISPNGFRFNLYGVDYTSFRITSNGYLVMWNGTAYSFSVPKSPSVNTGPGAYVAVFWCDLDPGAGGEIGWDFSNNVLSVEWKNVPMHSDTSKGVRAIARLDCSTYDIEMEWGAPAGLTPYTAWNVPDAVMVSSEISSSGSFDETLGYLPGYLNYSAVLTYPTDMWTGFEPKNPPYAITSPSVLPNGKEAKPYSFQLTAVGGTQPYTFYATGLAAGWSLSSTGDLSAAATFVNAGNWSFSVTVSDATTKSIACQFSITVDPAPLAIAPPVALPNGQEGASYGYQFSAQYAVGSRTWSATGLPGGWSMSTSGLLSAAANDVHYGSYSFDVSVTDSYSTPRTTTEARTIFVDAKALVVTTTSVGPFTAGTPASAPVSASGGWGTLTWAALNFPTGWNMDSQTGQITAAAQYVVAGQYSLQCQVSDQSGQNIQASWLVDVVPPGSLTLNGTTGLPTAQPGQAYTFHFVATGGVPGYSWSATGLPSGWSVSGGGDLTVAAADAWPGTYSFNLIVSDSAVPANTTSSARTLVVAPWPALVITPDNLPGGVVGQPYGQALTLSGGTGSGYLWSIVAGNLPPGISGATGNSSAAGLSGTPTQSGVYQFTIEVSDDGGNLLDQPLSITVKAPGLSAEKGTASAGGGCVAVGGAGLLWPILLGLLFLPAVLRRRTA